MILIVSWMRILVEKGLGLKSGAKSIYIKGDSAALIFTNYYRLHELSSREALFRIFRSKEV